LEITAMCSFIPSFVRRFHVPFLATTCLGASLSLALLLASTCSATTITFTEAGTSTEGTPLLVNRNTASVRTSLAPSRPPLGEMSVPMPVL